MRRFISKLINQTIGLGCYVLVLALCACDVHQFPGEEIEPELHKVTIDLDYDTNIPLYKVVEHQASRAQNASNYDVRYIIDVYQNNTRHSTEEQFVKRYVTSKDDVNSLDFSVDVELQEGIYSFYVWTDYVDGQTTNNKYYNADNLGAIRLIGEHTANTDFRDAFIGSTEAYITPETYSIRIENHRPLAKFNFITTDLDKFIDQLLELKAEKQPQNSANEDSGEDSQEKDNDIDINEYDIVFRYSGYMPNEFNAFINKPVDAIDNVSFKSKIKPLSDTEAELGFDYVFVNGIESQVTIIVEIYDKEGNLISAINPVEVPLIRSQLTTIRAEFLTSEASEGIGINPDFDDEYNYIVP